MTSPDSSVLHKAGVAAMEPVQIGRGDVAR